MDDQTWVVPAPPAPYGTTEATAGPEGHALALDRAIREVKKADWRGNHFKEREVRNAIRRVIGDDEERVERRFEIAKTQREY